MCIIVRILAGIPAGMILDDDWPYSPCRFPAVHTALQRKNRKTCHLLRSKLLELRSGLDSIPVSHPKIYLCRLAARLGPFPRAFSGAGEHRVKTFVLGVIVGMIVVPLCVYFYFASGTAPAAASDPPMPFETMIAHKALNARIAKEMPANVPIQADDANLTAGAQVYRHHCAICHGLPGQSEGGFAKGMFPHPPKLTEGKGVTDDEPGETYWKVANGIRLTGMPSFRLSLSKAPGMAAPPKQ